MSATDEGETQTPGARLLVAAGVAFEALLLGVVGVASVALSVTGAAEDRLGSLVLALTAVAIAAGLGAVANGVRHGARWSRTPTLVWQVLQVLVGVTGLPWKVGILLAVLGVAVGYGVLRADVVPREVRPPR
jgi:hypothetical protein